MLYVVTFLAAAFVAAYGNAMNKRVYRRAANIASGADLPEMSRAYKRTGNALFALGCIGMIVWFIALTFGNPMTFFANL